MPKTKLTMIFAAGLLGATILSAPASARDVQLCHVANAGFYVTDGEIGVLVDAVLGKPFGRYQQPSDELNEAIETSTGQFSDVKLVLMSHSHGDHFDAEATIRHIKHNENARYVLPPQAFGDMEKAGFGEKLERVHAILPEPGSPEQIEDIAEGLELKVHYVSHGARAQRENLGFVFSVSGVSFFHPGDIFTSNEALALERLNETPVDYFLVPSWQIASEAQLNVIDGTVAFHKIVPMHLFTKEASEGQAWYENQGGWEQTIENIMNVFPNSIKLLGEMDCIAAKPGG